jgi:glucose-6-phosphate isomerase
MGTTAREQSGAKRQAVKRHAWDALDAHYKKTSNLHLRQLFADDPNRGDRMAVEAVGLYLDYSKNRVTDETLRLLLRLAEPSGLQSRIEAMFRGEKINVTEKRAVLHVALRAPKGASIVVDGEYVAPKVHYALGKMADLTSNI